MNAAGTAHGNETLDPQMLECYRRATPGAKLAVVTRLNETLIALKEAALLKNHPDVTPAKRRELLRLWWFGAAD